MSHMQREITTDTALEGFRQLQRLPGQTLQSGVDQHQQRLSAVLHRRRSSVYPLRQTANKCLNFRAGA